jgi:hypothetical protein
MIEPVFAVERIDTWVFNVGVAIPVVCVIGLIVWHLLSSAAGKRVRNRKAVRSAPEPPEPFAFAKEQRIPKFPDGEQLLAGIFTNSSIGAATNQHIASLRNDPDQLQRTCDTVAQLLAELYLELAENWLRQGQAQQAAAVLQKLVQSCPQTRQAEVARERLRQSGMADERPQ